MTSMEHNTLSSCSVKQQHMNACLCMKLLEMGQYCDVSVYRNGYSFSIHVLIQQNEYRCIDILMYRCVLINELFSAMDKTLEIDNFTENSCEKNFVQYSDSHGFIPEEIILLLSVSW